MINKSLLHETISTILAALFDREEEQLARREKALIEKHVIQTRTDGFRYLGQIYTGLSGHARRLGKYTYPNKELIPALDLIQKERVTIADDKRWIQQALAMVLRECRTLQDVRDALPNSMTTVIANCRDLDRTRPEAFTLAENPQRYKQYMELRDQMDFYVAARLLY